MCLGSSGWGYEVVGSFLYDCILAEMVCEIFEGSCILVVVVEVAKYKVKGTGCTLENASCFILEKKNFSEMFLCMLYFL